MASVNPNYKEINAEEALADQDSVLYVQEIDRFA